MLGKYLSIFITSLDKNYQMVKNKLQNKIMIIGLWLTFTHVIIYGLITAIERFSLNKQFLLLGSNKQKRFVYTPVSDLSVVHCEYTVLEILF